MVRSETIYDEAIALGLTVDNHESDLYLKSSREADALVRRHPRLIATLFTSNTDRRLWWDIPFAYAPFWRKTASNAGR